MKIIDLDCVNPFMAPKINSWVFASCVQMKTENGGVVPYPSEPIYWYSSHRLLLDDVKKHGLVRVGEVWQAPTLIEMLHHMVEEIDKVAARDGLPKTKAFRRPVYVLTNKFFKEIVELNATPVTSELFK